MLVLNFDKFKKSVERELSSVLKKEIEVRMHELRKRLVVDLRSDMKLMSHDLSNQVFMKILAKEDKEEVDV